MKQTVEPSEKGKKLTASEVAVKTATIAVNVLQIGNKQFTYAVFDQLMEESIIDPDTGKLRGKPWGRVNRHTDCKELTKQNIEHVHIIWQKGNELRKAVAMMPWTATYYCSHPDEVPKSIACSYFRKREDRAKLAVLWLEARALAGERINLGSNKLIPFNINGFQFEVEINPTTVVNLRQPAQSWVARQFQQDLRRDVGTTKPDEVLALLAREAEALALLISTWEKTYKKLEQLDQLFIAV